MINFLTPRPDSNEELLDILIKLCNSNFIGRILGIGATIHIDLKLSCKKLYLPVINLSTPLAYGYYYYYDFDYECLSYKHNDYRKFPIQTDESAKENKTFNLHIEPEDKADVRLKSCSKNPKYRSIFLIPSGLNGIHKIISLFNHGFVDNEQHIGHVVEFAIEVCVLFDLWIKLVESKTEQEILKSIGADKENLGCIESWLNIEDNRIFINSIDKTVEFGQGFPKKELEIFIRKTWGDKFKTESYVI